MKESLPNKNLQNLHSETRKIGKDKLKEAEEETARELREGMEKQIEKARIETNKDEANKLFDEDIKMAEFIDEEDQEKAA